MWCYRRICNALLKHLEKRLAINRGETTADGNYTLQTVECLASCGTAPVLQINNEFVENVTPDMLNSLVDSWDRELQASNTADQELQASNTAMKTEARSS